MLCENCKKREANVCYSENINGVKREMHLCEECSKELGETSNGMCLSEKELGISEQMNFNMGLDFPSIFGGIFEDFPMLLNEVKDVTCKTCGLSFDDIVSTGRLGCPDCYETFESRLDPILKRLQGSNRHNGRLGEIPEKKIDIKKTEKKKETETTKESKIEKLEKELKDAIKEEKYEEAAKIRDEIKKLSK